jgi:hypothetical protein
VGRDKNLACNQYELEREFGREIRLRRLETHSIGFVARASTPTRTVVYVFETQLIDGLEPKSECFLLQLISSPHTMTMQITSFIGGKV